MNLDATQALVTIALGGVGLLTALFAFLRWVRPWWRRMKKDYTAGRDALVGRDAVVDSITGKELSPALPGIGQRMANVEAAIVAIAQQQEDITVLKAAVSKHGERIQKLEDAAVERVVSRAESVAAFKAMEAAIKAEPDQDVEFTD